MEIIIIAFVAMGIGMVLIFFIGRTSPVHPAAGGSITPGGDLAWMRAEGSAGFARLLANLFGEMGYATERSNHADDTVDLYAVNPKPITGGKIYVRGIIDPPHGKVGADEVRSVSETVRAEYAGKGIVVTLAAFDNAAVAEAREVNVDLVDGGELASLVKKHLPQVFALKKIGS